MRKKKALKPKPNHREDSMIEALDQLAQFQDLQRDVLPKLIEYVKQGKSTEEILATGEAVAAARLVSMTMSGDERTAFASIKEILDRRLGKATERKEITHRLDKLPEEELDAIIMSQIEDLSDDD